MTDRYRAQIDGFELDVETIEDSIENAIARHEYPYRDGAALQNMGQRARRIRLRCWWIEERYEGHYGFVEHLKSRELFELSHPKYGLMTGAVEAVHVRHDDRQQTAAVDIEFIQDMLSQEQPAPSRDVTAAVEEAFIDSQAELMESFSAQAADALGAEAAEVLAAELDPDLGIVEQFAGVGTTVRNWLKTVESFVGAVQQEAIGVANPANSIIAAIDYGANLPGRVIGAVAQAFERHAILNDSLKTAPERYLENLKNALDDLADAAGDFAGITRGSGAARMAAEAAQIFADDEQQRNRQRSRENASGAFDVEGNYLSPDTPAAVLTVRELELSLATVRAELQAAIDADRTLQSAKDMARELLEHVMVVKLERDRLVRIALDNPMPLHLVCLMRGLPYAYAERIYAVNAIAHPNFTQGEIDVYVR